MFNKEQPRYKFSDSQYLMRKLWTKQLSFNRATLQQMLKPGITIQMTHTHYPVDFSIIEYFYWNNWLVNVEVISQRYHLPLCMPVNLSFSTVSSYILPKFSKSGFSSFSSRFRGIWPMNNLMASWSLLGVCWLLSQLFCCPTLNCLETGSTNPFTSVAMLIIWQHACGPNRTVTDCAAWSKQTFS